MEDTSLQEKKRSNQQSKALHLWFELLAEELNNAGLEMRKVLKPEIEISWTKNNVKEYLYKPILHALTLKSSTTEMNTAEPSKVYEIIVRHLGEKFGLECPAFPSEADTENYINSFNK